MLKNDIVQNTYHAMTASLIGSMRIIKRRMDEELL